MDHQGRLMRLYCPGNMEELITFSKFLFNIRVGGARGGVRPSWVGDPCSPSPVSPALTLTQGVITSHLLIGLRKLQMVQVTVTAKNLFYPSFFLKYKKDSSYLYIL